MIRIHHALDRSYRECSLVARQSGSNFYRSFHLLRPDRRRGMMALYAFARLVDDWGDGPDSVSAIDQVGRWHAWLDGCLEPSTEPPKDPSRDVRFPQERLDAIRGALADTLRRFAIPIRHLHAIIDGVNFDLEVPVAIQNRAQLDEYCYLVASSVGLACLCIWGGNPLAIERSAIDCGIAFQLTNILRDVCEDGRRGRIYVPDDLLVAHGVDRERWLAGHPDGDWKSVLETLIESARMRYRSGWEVQNELDVDGQRMFSLMWRTYWRLLDRIAEDLDAVWERRIGLTPAEKARLYMQHAITPWFRRLPSRYEIDD